MDTGLYLLRHIDPPTPLLEQLRAINHTYEFESGETYVDDDVMRDMALNNSITGFYVDGPEGRGTQFVPGCTKGFGIFDSDLNRLAYYRDYRKALTAMERAKPRVVTEFELEQEEAEAQEPEPVKKKPFEA